MALVLAAVTATGCASTPEARGRRAMDRGQFEIAAREYRDALEARPDDASLWAHLARAEQLAERPARAREAFEKVAALRPDDPGPLIEVGMSYELERQYDHALVAYEAAVERAPDDAYPRRVLGARLLRWGFPDRAIPQLRRAVELDPSHVDAWNALGIALHEVGDLDGSARVFFDAVHAHPEALELRLGLAGVLVNAHRFEEALGVYDGIAASRPRFAAVHVGRGLVLDALGRYPEAEAAFARAVEVAEEKGPYQTRLRAYRALRRGGHAGAPDVDAPEAQR